MNILRKPVVTEKSINEYKTESKVTFEVDLKANKIVAAKVLENVFGVTVEGVWVNNRLGKKGMDRTRRREVNIKPNKKIMVFKLKKGDKIDIFNQ